MTNEEFYKDELKNIVKIFFISVTGVDKLGQPRRCIELDCDDCIFKGNCTKEAKKEWLKAEYVEPEQQVDWSRVKVDTPIYVRDSVDDEWTPRYFAKYEDGRVYTWVLGMTSFTTDEISFFNYKYAKLAESEE